MSLRTICLLAFCLGTPIPSVGQLSPADYADPLVGTSNSRWMLGPLN